MHERADERERSGAEDGDVARQIAFDDEGLVTLMTNLYRDEMRRTVAWRQRLDNTTNWAVILISALLTWAFSSETNPHYVLLIGIAAAVFLLVLEARRFRSYDVWRARIRMIEKNVFASALDPSDDPQADWRRLVSEDLRRPAFKIPRRVALRHRLRRVYLALLGLLLAAWVTRVTAFDPGPWSPDAAAIGAIPGWLVIGAVALFYVLAAGLAFWPLADREREISREAEEADGWDD